MTKDELLQQAMDLLKKANEDKRTELKIRLSIPRLLKEYERLKDENRTRD